MGPPDGEPLLVQQQVTVALYVGDQVAGGTGSCRPGEAASDRDVLWFGLIRVWLKVSPDRRSHKVAGVDMAVSWVTTLRRSTAVTTAFPPRL
jgi:hypothetical protein